MELLLQRGLPHQQKAIDAVCSVFDGVEIMAPNQFFENPAITLTDPVLYTNIRAVQMSLPAEQRSISSIDDCLNLDIKMETGTGKTYVYTSIMFELHRRFGFNKFIIAVPSLTIKAGISQFLQDEYVRRHFADSCGYGTEMDVEVLEARRSRKTAHSFFPGAVSAFVRGSNQINRKIYVLLVNMQLLTTMKNSMLSREDYGFGVDGFYRPYDALKATRPIIIIDEPHRFSRVQKAYSVIMDEIHPQSVMRFGATFPEITTRQGKNKTIVKDYQNLLYDLNACESFNQGLIKGVAKEHFEPISRREEKVKISSITSRSYVTFQHKKLNSSERSYTLGRGDSLSIISDAFEGITIEAISSTSVEFSNGVVKTKGEELDVDIYMTSYQEQMMRLALDRHFETEYENFCNRTFKIKTLALFFIDDISAYRPDTNGKKPYLLESFERLLREKIEKIVNGLDKRDWKYREYLEASLAQISACHAGYFSRDNSDTDENIAKEVDVILHGKKQLLSFYNEDGSYNTLRFLFSKWTLKEGWDNPNVFTIAKLRSSGSEISKIQEVGRGLRLPVDENGNRIENEEFLLNYIVDFTERDFADRLVEQINEDIPLARKITEEKLQAVARKLNMSADDLFDELYKNNYIDRHCNIRTETRNVFLERYPDFAAGLASGKVKDRNKTKSRMIKINENAFHEIRQFWENINHPYLLSYDETLNAELGTVVLSIFEQKAVFKNDVMRSNRDLVISDGTRMETAHGSGVQYTVARPIGYGVFLKRIMRVTNIPLIILHKAFCTYVERNGEVDPIFINESSVISFCNEFQIWKNRHLLDRIHYVRSAARAGGTALSYEDGSPRKDIAQGRIGTKIAPGTPDDKYLYDTYAYDSPLEKENMLSNIEEVVVYGKIPRNSIAIPTITGDMYSPDFMYVIRTASDIKEVNVVMETKDVANKSEIRETERVKIECARAFFNQLTRDGYTVYFRDQDNNQPAIQVLYDILNLV
ncbi:MAG: type III restriction-modification system endonuclease [Lachnospiraceae bacterium]|nr:type III restriction-modification system endonuclease [Lachnospiraceae bacterium]